MSPLRQTAIPAAVMLVVALGACQDAPMAPHGAVQDIAKAPGVAQSIDVQTYSGQRADFVISQLLGAWAAHGHPEYQEARAAWHPKATPSGAAVPATAKSPTSSNAMLDGTAGIKPSPQIVLHHENLYFGHYGDGFSIPSGVNAFMQFVGDVGRIDLGSLSITGSGGSSFPATGPIATGSGLMVNCSDVILGQCGSVKQMEGALTFSDAPTCDVNGSGNVVYTAFNVSSSLGAVTPVFTDGSQEATAVANGALSSSAPACSTTDPNGNGPAAPGGGDGPPPVWPENPSPAPDPWAPPLSGGNNSFHCETTQWWSYGFLQGEVTNCYADN